MKKLLLSSILPIFLLLGNENVLAQTFYLEDQEHILILKRDGLDWYLARPVSTATSVLFNIFVSGTVSEEHRAMSMIAEAKCTEQKKLSIFSERLYFYTEGFQQFDEEQVYTDLPEDSPLGIAQTIACGRYYDPNSEVEVISNPKVGELSEIEPR